MPRKSLTPTPTPSASPDMVDGVGQLQTAFLALISHELRSPLTAIKGYAATLRRSGRRLTASERDEFLRAIEQASDRLDCTISRLLQLARLEAGALTPDLAPVDMVYLTREALAVAEQRWGAGASPGGGHGFVPPQQSVLPLALADRRLLREALDIAVENAAHYSPAGTDILVRARVAGPALVMSVRDFGPGIAPERQRRLFQPFAQPFARLESSLIRERGGLGIGLALLKRIMTLQGGDVWVESAPGGGSVFSLSLPLVEP